MKRRAKQARLAHLHMLTSLGRWWGAGEPRLAPDPVRSYTRHVDACGNGVSRGVPMLPEGGIRRPPPRAGRDR